MSGPQVIRVLALVAALIGFLSAIGLIVAGPPPLAWLLLWALLFTLAGFVW